MLLSMSTLFQCRFLHSLVLMLAFFLSGNSHAEVLSSRVEPSNTITFVADRWPPFNDVPDSEMEGYMMDVARAVFEPQGYKVVYKNMPWNRAIVESRKGRFDAIIGASRVDAPDFVFPEEELGRNKLSFYITKESNWTFKDVSSLEQVYLGVIDGYDYRAWFKEYERTHPEKIYVRHGKTPLKENLKLLLHGRLDAVVDNEAALRWVAKDMGILDQLKSGGEDTVGGVSYIYHAFSPARPTSGHYARLLSQGIRELRENGRLQAILDRYGIQDWQKK